jgi:4-amino-4-deoxy-L-arabinose transferase-like glycosyltransferase
MVGVVGIFMVGVLAHRLAGRRAAVAAAAIAAVYPPLVWTSSYALSEALFWPLGLIVAWSLDRAFDQRGSAIWAGTAGVIAGASILVRPGLLLVVPMAMGIAAVRRQWLAALAIGLGVALVVGPWTARNYLTHGRLIVVAAEGGVTFWTGNHPLATGDGDMAVNIAIKRDHERFRAAHPGLAEEAIEPLYYREALTWMATHPVEWVALEFRKMFYLIVPVGPSYTLHSTRYYAASVVSYLSVLALALAAWFSRGAWRGQSLGLAGLAASAVAGVLIFFAQERFRIPVIDPALVIVAGVGLAHLTLGSRR